MDNPNVVLDDDDDDISEEEPGETIRLRPYYDWRAENPSASMADFPRVSSQVPLSPKVYTSDDMFGYELAIENDEEDDDFDDDDDDDDDDLAATRGHHPIKRLPSIHRSTSKARKRAASGAAGGAGGASGGKKKLQEERGTWQGRFDFILSLIGYSVGLGNVWRFPYLVYSNGGGAFLIPFIVMMCFVGFPLMFMELAFGQYASLSPVVIFKRFSPLFAGIGYGMIAISAIVMLYYNMIIAWTIYYLYVSFSSTLPWVSCDPAWSTDLCFSHKDKDDCSAADPTGIYYNRTCWDAVNATRLNIAKLVHHSKKKSPSDEYFNNYVLGNIGTIDHLGNIQWHLLVSLGAAWLMVFACLCKGVQSSGKVVYFTALFPYVVLVILFVRGITLPGAMEGILFYVTPDFSRLFVAQVWGDAAVQVFFALSPSWGGLITLASYNKFTNNCYRDSILVLFANAATSIFSGFVVFSIIGYLAHELDVPVTEVVNEGVGLAFMVYPEVVARLPISPFWSFMFFLMLITLGLDSQFALLETVQTAVLDRFPKLRGHKFAILTLVSLAGYTGGIIFTTGSGVLWLGLFDKYAANFSVLIIAITECVLISWYYGTERFIRDIEKMIGPRSATWKVVWTWIWKFVTPMTLIFILVFNWIQHEPARAGTYLYPRWADVFGWALAFVPTVIILVTIVYTYVTYGGSKNKSVLQKLNALMQPSDAWGPTHKNIERLQRRSITSAANQSRKNSSIRGKECNGPQSHQSTITSIRQSNGGGGGGGTQGNPVGPNGTTTGGTQRVSILNGGPQIFSKANQNRPAPILINANNGRPLLPKTGECSTSNSSSTLTIVTPTNLSQKSSNHCSVIMDDQPLKGGLTPKLAPELVPKANSKTKKSSTSDSTGSFDNPSFDADKNKETKI